MPLPRRLVSAALPCRRPSWRPCGHPCLRSWQACGAYRSWAQPRLGLGLLGGSGTHLFVFGALQHGGAGTGFALLLFLEVGSLTGLQLGVALGLAFPGSLFFGAQDRAGHDTRTGVAGRSAFGFGGFGRLGASLTLGLDGRSRLGLGLRLGLGFRLGDDDGLGLGALDTGDSDSSTTSARHLDLGDSARRRAPPHRRRRRSGRTRAPGPRRLTKTRFLRTSTCTVRARPVESVARISLVACASG
jgi:hypothetical protein